MNAEVPEIRVWNVANEPDWDEFVAEARLAEHWYIWFPAKMQELERWLDVERACSQCGYRFTYATSVGARACYAPYYAPDGHVYRTRTEHVHSGMATSTFTQFRVPIAALHLLKHDITWSNVMRVESVQLRRPEVATDVYDPFLSVMVLKTRDV